MDAPTVKPKSTFTLAAGSAMTFVVLFGFISLFSDMTYEGARSMSGQYLKILGASAFAVGFAAGAGELLGYALRLVSGYITDRTKQYWLVTITGYTVQLLSVPLLALTGRWEWAFILLLTERIGKAIRNPSRDAMLSYATKQMGRGFGFGLHEAMDQIGAFLGPLIVAAVLFLRGGLQDDAAAHRAGFAVLLVPAIIALTLIQFARLRYPRPAELESKTPVVATKGFSRRYWLYLLGAGLIATGYADFALINYHFKTIGLAPDRWLPIFFAVAMGVDAIAAIVFGTLYDKKGFPVLVAAFSLSALFAPFAFLGNLPLALVGVGLWGIGMGIQESIMRAVVADLVPSDRRASGYGLFHFGFGIMWFLGSALMGFLYDQSVTYIVIFSLVAQFAAIPVFLLVRRQAAVGGH
ncbi:MAG: MFS transporter [Anaerolineae bacterium]|nr:MFS transporter [Anaerolineae bacterium]